MNRQRSIVQVRQQVRELNVLAIIFMSNGIAYFLIAITFFIMKILNLGSSDHHLWYDTATSGVCYSSLAVNLYMVYRFRELNMLDFQSRESLGFGGPKQVPEETDRNAKIVKQAVDELLTNPLPILADAARAIRDRTGLSMQDSIKAIRNYQEDGVPLFASRSKLWSSILIVVGTVYFVAVVYGLIAAFAGRPLLLDVLLFLFYATVLAVLAYDRIYRKNERTTLNS